MGARVRWAAFGVALLVALGLVALYVFIVALSTSATVQRDPKTWFVQPGETLLVPVEEVLLEDRFECVDGDPTPGLRRGHVLNGLAVVPGSSLSTMTVDEEGNVTVHCAPRPSRASVGGLGLTLLRSAPTLAGP